MREMNILIAKCRILL